MTREEFNEKATELLANASDTGKVSELLDELRTGFNEEVSKSETAVNQVSELTTKNENLQKANMELFLKVGETKEEKEEEEEEEEEVLSYDELFDEKTGGLK